jgi:hypothetical protein
MKKPVTTTHRLLHAAMFAAVRSAATAIGAAGGAGLIDIMIHIATHL